MRYDWSFLANPDLYPKSGFSEIIQGLRTGMEFAQMKQNRAHQKELEDIQRQDTELNRAKLAEDRRQFNEKQAQERFKAYQEQLGVQAKNELLSMVGMTARKTAKNDHEIYSNMARELSGLNMLDEADKYSKMADRAKEDQRGFGTGPAGQSLERAAQVLSRKRNINIDRAREIISVSYLSREQNEYNPITGGVTKYSPMDMPPEVTAILGKVKVGKDEVNPLGLSKNTYNKMELFNKQTEQAITELRELSKDTKFWNVGLPGMVNRLREGVHGYVDPSIETQATQYKQRIEHLRTLMKEAYAGGGAPSNFEWERVDKAIAGMGVLDNAAVVKDSHKTLLAMLSGMVSHNYKAMGVTFDHNDMKPDFDSKGGLDSAAKSKIDSDLDKLFGGQ